MERIFYLEYQTLILHNRNYKLRSFTPTCFNVYKHFIFSLNCI